MYNVDATIDEVNEDVEQLHEAVCDIYELVKQADERKLSRAAALDAIALICSNLCD